MSPRRRRTALWVSLVAAGVSVAVVLVTGFVVPGFFLRHDRSPGTAAASSQVPSTGGPTTSRTPFSRSDPGQLQAARQVTEEFLCCLNANAIDGPGGAKAMGCPGSESLLGGTLLAVAPPTQLAIPTQGEVRFRDPVIEVDVAGVTNQRAVTGYVRLQPWQDHQPCVRILVVR
ncbi:hypothetical protein [Amycolatopsis vastitatis]|uniref:Uncharacterized protein n=1 Tax=Amycolatopsis vastitatis TaxID=1905142 RepID=A0A229TBG0_9PSEU|nr:hypothetical protein [Amycolatopsis vastitatis]OXM68254.1 hypothetical protein CF165_14005 [Amycolatopsis vastitatis]